MDDAGSRLGLELEMTVAHRESGASHPVSGYFQALARIKSARGEAVALHHIGPAVTGVQSPLGESGLDNGYNLLETSFSPVEGGPGGLDRLAARVGQELRDVQEGLAEEGAVVLNVSEHPAATLDADWYARVRVPRPIYAEVVGYRGWLHRIGIDAKAQNSPCTAVPVRDAIRALNVVLALAPGMIALFANSPLECGRPTGFKENRLTHWGRVFRHSRFAGDFFLQQLPERPYADLGDYFRWMFGSNTSSRALPLRSGEDYKSAASACLAGDPPLSRFLAAASWNARRVDTGEPVVLTPHASYFEYSQIANFLDARWRYRLLSYPPLDELLRAWRQPGGLETLFERHGVDGYIEGRAPGAAFPDTQLIREAGAEIAATVTMAASAIQLGLMRNLGQAEDLVRDWGWLRLRGLRDIAMRVALDDDAVHALASQVIEVAKSGLDAGERRWLGYAEYTLASRRTGADRLLSLWNSLAGHPRQCLPAVVAARALKLP